MSALKTTLLLSDDLTLFSRERFRPLKVRGPPPRFLGVLAVSAAGGSSVTTMTGASRVVLGPAVKGRPTLGPRALASESRKAGSDAKLDSARWMGPRREKKLRKGAGLFDSDARSEDPGLFVSEEC